MNSRLVILLIFCIVIISACGGDEERDDPQPTSAPTNNAAPAEPVLAELTVNGKTSLKPPLCLGTHSVGGTQIFVWNSSTNDIVAPFIVEVDGVQQTIDSLIAGEVRDLFFEMAGSGQTSFTAVVDPDNRIPETDETNNTFTGPVMTLTPPPPCTPTP